MFACSTFFLAVNLKIFVCCTKLRKIDDEKKDLFFFYVKFQEITKTKNHTLQCKCSDYWEKNQKSKKKPSKLETIKKNKNFKKLLLKIKMKRKQTKKH